MVSATPEEEARKLVEALREREGELADIEGLCAEYPHLARELRRIGSSTLLEFSFFRRAERPRAGEVPGPVHAGDVIDDFELIEPIDRGAQGEVWLAEQLGLERRVALKLLDPAAWTDRARAFFDREARAAARLSHPGIVTIHAQGITEGRPWIAMEVVEGGSTLSDFLRECRDVEALPPDYDRRVAELVAQIAEAMQAAHDAGVIHRDLKPQNILITSDDRPKVTDFGLARIIDEKSLSGPGDLVGTYAYMSPEQIAGRRAGLDHRSDVFSLGVITYELLSLRRPFQGETTAELAEKILADDPPDLRQVRPGVPSHLAADCHKALSKSKGDRFQTMGEFAQELRRFLEGRPSRVRPPSRWRKVLRTVRRRPGVLAAGTTALAAALALFVVTREPPPEPFAANRPLLVSDTEHDDHSPTFVGGRYLVFERRGDPPDPAALWYVDLTSPSLLPRRWSPEGESCRNPSADPSGRWIAYETDAWDSRPGAERSVLVLRECATVEGPLAWPDEELAVLEDERGSISGPEWSRDGALLFTRDLGDVKDLCLLKPGEGLEEARVITVRHTSSGGPGRDDARADGAIQACFSPDGERVAIAGENALEVFRIVGAPPFPLEVRSLDCGTYRRPLWMDDGSMLVVRRWSGEPSARLLRLEGNRISRLERLELRRIESVLDVAAAPGGLLALECLTASTTAAECSLGGAEPRELAARFPPLHMAGAPDGSLVYSGDTGSGMRLFVLDRDRGSDRPLDVDLRDATGPDDFVHLDQVSFSQNARSLAFRAKVEPANGRCDTREWVVVQAWPPGTGETRLFPTNGHGVAFPHATDDGERVVWCDPEPRPHLVLARWNDGDVVITDRRETLHWPVCISGDGAWIAGVLDLGASSSRIRLMDGEGTERSVVGFDGMCAMPVWLPREEPAVEERLAYLGSRDASSALEVRVVDVESADERGLGDVRSPEGDLRYATYDPWSGSVFCTMKRRGRGKIWLSEPAD